MRIVSVLILIVIMGTAVYHGCSDQQELTKLETELLSALIINFQNIAQGAVNPEQPENTLYLLKHIAHIKGTVPNSLVYAMVLDSEGRIVAHNMLGDRFTVGQKLDDEPTINVLTYRDPEAPYFQFIELNGTNQLVDVSLPVMPQSEGSLPEGFVRIGINREN